MTIDTSGCKNTDELMDRIIEKFKGNYELEPALTRFEQALADELEKNFPTIILDVPTIKNVASVLLKATDIQHGEDTD